MLLLGIRNMVTFTTIIIVILLFSFSEVQTQSENVECTNGNINTPGAVCTPAGPSVIKSSCFQLKNQILGTNLPCIYFQPIGVAMLGRSDEHSYTAIRDDVTFPMALDYDFTALSILKANLQVDIAKQTWSISNVARDDQRWSDVRDHILSMDYRIGDEGSNLDLDRLVIVNWQDASIRGSEDKKYTMSLTLAEATNRRTYMAYHFEKITSASFTVGSTNHFLYSGFNLGNGRGWHSLPWSNSADIVKLEGNKFWFDITDTNIRYFGCIPQDVRQRNASEVIMFGEEVVTLQMYKKTTNFFGGELAWISGPQSFQYPQPTAVFDGVAVDGYSSAGDKTWCRARFGVPRTNQLGRVEVTAEGFTTSYMSMFRLSNKEALVKLNANWFERDMPLSNFTWPSNILGTDVTPELWGYTTVNESDEVYRKIADFNCPPVGDDEVNVCILDNDAGPACPECDDFRVAYINVTLRPYSDGSYPSFYSYKSIFSAPFPLQWNSRSEKMSAVFHNKQCQAWVDRDADSSALNNLTPCPCTLQQAESDLARYRKDEFCTKYDRSTNCLYHKAAHTCYRNIDSNEKPTHCCYLEDGQLMLTLETSKDGRSQGSHAEQFSILGSDLQSPNFAHFLSDKIPYFDCCVFSKDRCGNYHKKRPVSTCATISQQRRDYAPLSYAAAFGYGHFSTFNGVNYRLLSPGGKYHLLKCPKITIIGEVDVKFDGLKEVRMTTDRSEVVVSVSNPVVVSVYNNKLDSIYNFVNLIDVKINGELYFTSQKVIYPSRDLIVYQSGGNLYSNITILFPRIATFVRFTRANKMAPMSVLVGAPTAYKDGLFSSGVDEKSSNRILALKQIVTAAATSRSPPSVDLTDYSDVAITNELCENIVQCQVDYDAAINLNHPKFKNNRVTRNINDRQLFADSVSNATRDVYQGVKLLRDFASSYAKCPVVKEKRLIVSGVNQVGKKVHVKCINKKASIKEGNLTCTKITVGDSFEYQWQPSPASFSCLTARPPKKVIGARLNFGIVVGLIVLAIVLILIAVFTFYYLRKKRQHKQSYKPGHERPEGETLVEKNPQ